MQKTRVALAGLMVGAIVLGVPRGGWSEDAKPGLVGSETVLVTQLTGKEFFDVLIDLDEVAAVELRVRGK